MSREVYHRSSGSWVLISAGSPVPMPPLGSPPTAPSGLTLAPGESYVQASWTASTDADSDLAGYELFLNGVSQGTLSGVTSTVLSSLTPATSYTVGVRAIDAAGHMSATTTATTTTSTAGGPPTPASVGPRIGLTVINGDYVVSAGETLSGKYVTGSIYMPNANSTVVDCKAGGLAVNMAPGGNYYYPVRVGQTARYCEFGSVYTTGADTFTLDHCRIGNSRGTFAQIADYAEPNKTFQCRNITITNCYWDRLTGTGSGIGHFEALHLMGCQGALIRNNVWSFTTSDAGTFAQITAALNFDNGNGTGLPCRDIVFDKNQLYGGGAYQIYLSIRGSSQVTNNEFHSYSGMGLAQYPPTSGTTFTQSGNTLDGSPITLATA